MLDRDSEVLSTKNKGGSSSGRWRSGDGDLISPYPYQKID
jgi:hypothetical protein